MKKLMKFGLVMAALLAMAVTTFANNTDFSVRVNGNIGKTVRFSVLNTPAIHLTIVSDNQEILFEEDALAGSGIISRQYDLKSLPVGHYLLTAETPSKISTYTIEVSAETAIISKNPIAEVTKPVVVAKNGRVSLSIVNASVTPISITLVDEANNELYSETTSDRVSLVKMFDFRNVAKSEYTFITKYGNQTFTSRVIAGN